MADNVQLIEHRDHLDIGQFNERVTLQTAAEQSDGGGGVVAVAWGNDVTYWGKVDFRESSFQTAAGHLQQESTMTVTVRYRTEIDEIPPKKMNQRRLVYNQRAYKIKSVRRVNNEKYFLIFELDGNSWQAV